MKKLIVLALAVATVAGAAAQNTAAPQYENVIQVWGAAEREIQPDEFYISITINEKDSKGKVSVEEQESQMRAALKRLGVDVARQLRVVDMSSAYYKRGNSLAYNNYELKLSTPDEVARVFQALTDLGISDATLSRVDHSQMQQFKQEIRAEAMRAAQRNARILAEAVGQQAGRCVYINDSDSGVRPVYANFVMRAAKASDSMEAGSVAAGTGLEFRNIKLEHSVQAKFVLE